MNRTNFGLKQTPKTPRNVPLAYPSTNVRKTLDTTFWLGEGQCRFMHFSRPTDPPREARGSDLVRHETC